MHHKMYNSVIFNIFTDMCNPLQLILQYFCCLKTSFAALPPVLFNSPAQNNRELVFIFYSPILDL